MQRQIVTTEFELDVLINRAFWAGVCAGAKQPDLVIRGALGEYKVRRDAVRKELKELHKV